MVTVTGESVQIQKTGIENAFHELGKPVPKFTAADCTSFVSELNQQVAENATKYRGSAAKEAVANAKLVERTAYANAVAEGKEFSNQASALIQEATALRNNKGIEEALAGRIATLTRSGMSQANAVEAATKAFLAESRGFVNNSSATLARGALQAEGAEAGTFQKLLGSVGGEQLMTALRGAGGALSMYMLYSAYKEGGKTALAKELVNQGLCHLVPPAALLELAGAAVGMVGRGILDCANNSKNDAALASILGSTPEALRDAYAKWGKDPAGLRAEIEKEWSEQAQWTGVYEGKGLSSTQIKELMLAKAQALLDSVGKAIALEKDDQAAKLEQLKLLAEQEKKAKEAKNADRKPDELLLDKQARDKEAVLAKAKADEESEQEKEAIRLRKARKKRELAQGKQGETKQEVSEKEQNFRQQVIDRLQARGLPAAAALVDRLVGVLEKDGLAGLDAAIKEVGDMQGTFSGKQISGRLTLTVKGTTVTATFFDHIAIGSDSFADTKGNFSGWHDPVSGSVFFRGTATSVSFVKIGKTERRTSQSVPYTFNGSFTGHGYRGRVMSGSSSIGWSVSR